MFYAAGFIVVELLYGLHGSGLMLDKCAVCGEPNARTCNYVAGSLEANVTATRGTYKYMTEFK
jgi:hypothetical protein